MYMHILKYLNIKNFQGFMTLMIIEMRLVKRVQRITPGSVMFNFLTGMKTRLCGMEIQCVRCIALLFNNMPDVQLAKHPSCKKQQQKWTKTPINSF